MTFPLRCDVLRALYHTHFRDSKADKELSRLIEKRIKPASTIRHRYAHAMWLKDDSGNSILLEKDSRGKPDVSPRTITVKDLGAEALTIFAAYFQISTYLSGLLIMML